MHSFDLGANPVRNTISLVADYLEQLTVYNSSLAQPGLSSFHAQSIPTIDIHSYLHRIQKYCPAPNECFIAILVYMHRLMRHNQNGRYEDSYAVDPYSVHRLVITGIMASAKYFSDVFFTNSRYAKVGGIPVAELNHLEIHLLVALDFQLAIPIAELQYYGDLLARNTLPYSPPCGKVWELAAQPTFELTDASSSSSSSINLPCSEPTSLESSTTNSPPSRFRQPCTHLGSTPPLSTSCESLKAKPSSVTTTATATAVPYLPRCSSSGTSLPNSLTRHFRSSIYNFE